MYYQKWKKSDSFAAHYIQHFKSTTSCTDLCKCMTFKVVKQLKPDWGNEIIYET